MKVKKLYQCILFAFMLFFALNVSCGEFIKIDLINNEPLKIESEYYIIEYDLKEGLWSAYKKNGEIVLKNVFAEANFQLSKGKKSFKTNAPNLERSYTVLDYEKEKSKGKLISILHQDKANPIIFKQNFIILSNTTSIITYIEIENFHNENLKFYSISPVKANFENEGGVFLGKNPDDIWVLENGYDFKFNFWVRLIPVSVNSISDWNSALYDKQTGNSLIGGFLNSEYAILQVNVNYQKGKTLKENLKSRIHNTNYKQRIPNNEQQTENLKLPIKDYREGITGYSGNCKYMPFKMVLPKSTLATEKFYIDFLSKTPQDGLENFAAMSALFSGVKEWKGEVPTGWNSWATEYHHDIDENKMLLNARFVRDNLLDYGMTYFQIDDPWQLTRGDWEANSNFPSGMKNLLGEIKNMGLKPGLWLAPFVVSTNSSIYREKRHWIVKKSFLGETIMSADEEILDLSHPEVKEWLYNLFYKLKNEWGCVWFKLDFIYYALLGEDYYDKGKTNVEIFREALKIIRSAIGDDSFMMLVAVPIYTGLGIADGMRIGLDNTPLWNDDEEYTAQGLKPLYKSLVRRYYLNNRVWIIHPDMFYLGVEREEKKRWNSYLSLEEAKTYASIVGLMGGITKIGNLFTNLNDEQLKVLKSLLPVFRGNARPVDLFEMKFPEVWDLKINIPSKEDASKEGLNYDVIGLINWGVNAHWGKEIDESIREIKVDFKKIGLTPLCEAKHGERYHLHDFSFGSKSKSYKVGCDYLAFEFWDSEFLGVFRNELSIKIPPRKVKIISLHEYRGHPQFLSTNRHISQGGTDLKFLKWDNNNFILEGRMLVDKGFDYKIFFYIPEGFSIKNIDIGDLQYKYELNDNILTLNFVPSEKKEIVFKLEF